MSPHVRGILQRMYESVIRRVLIGGRLSDPVVIEVGVAQGSVLSPLLYAAYIDGLHAALRREKLGIWMAGRLVPLLMYADDIVLLASSAEAMQRMCEVVSNYARQHRFEVNHGKSNLVVFGPKAARAKASSFIWKLGERSIEITDYYRYLGAEVDAKGRKWSKLVARLVENGSSYVNRLLWQGHGAWGFQPNTYAALWKAEGRSKTEYGCELWEGEIRLQDENQLERVQYKCGKAALGLPANMKPAAVGIRMELGLLPLKFRREALKLLYWERLCHASPTRTVSLVFRQRHRQFLSGSARKSWFRAMEGIMRRWELQEFWVTCTALNREEWKARIWTQYERLGEAHNASALADKSSLQLYQRVAPPTLKHAACLQDRSNHGGSWAQTRLRLGIAPLLGRLYRLLDLPTEAAICRLCWLQPEDTAHFLCHCPRFAEERAMFASQVRDVLQRLGDPGLLVLHRLMRDPTTLLDIALGAHFDFPPPRGTKREVNRYKSLCAKTLWALNKSAKNFLMVVWRKRRALLGDLNIAHGRIVRTPPKVAVVRWLERHRRSSLAPDQLPHIRLHGRGVLEFWKPWVQYVEDNRSKQYKKSRRKNFFRVWRGTQTGLFYKWSDCLAAIKHVHNPKFRGFKTLQEAILFNPP